MKSVRWAGVLLLYVAGDVLSPPASRVTAAEPTLPDDTLMIDVAEQGSVRGADVLPSKFGPAVDRDVRMARAATESFKVLENAIAAGYEGRVARCIENRSEGGMGFHHKNHALRDGRLEIDKPEILLYAHSPDGQYKLTGVEYIVPFSAWSRSEPPAVMGQNLKRSEILGVWYLHVWIWEANPSGLFADWNPRIRCGEG